MVTCRYEKDMYKVWHETWASLCHLSTWHSAPCFVYLSHLNQLDPGKLLKYSPGWVFLYTTAASFMSPGSWSEMACRIFSTELISFTVIKSASLLSCLALSNVFLWNFGGNVPCMCLFGRLRKLSFWRRLTMAISVATGPKSRAHTTFWQTRVRGWEPFPPCLRFPWPKTVFFFLLGDYWKFASLDQISRLRSQRNLHFILLLRFPLASRCLSEFALVE